MEIRPVGGKQSPNYPRREDVSPETLKAQPPQRWAVNTAALIAMGTLAAVSLAGCRTAGPPLPPEMATEETAGIIAQVETPVVDMAFVGEPTEPMLRIAPLFEHGDGLGAFGCVMVAPPVFLSESEALAVINEVAKDYGLAFSEEGGTEFYNVRQPSVNTLEPDKTQPLETMITLKPDFTDQEHGIAIEFVSVDDIKSWDPNYTANGITEMYATKDAADQLSSALDAAGSDADVAAGVMYDPCEFSAESEAQTRVQSVGELKKQAKDFFEWLKSQGLI